MDFSLVQLLLFDMVLEAYSGCLLAGEAQSWRRGNRKPYLASMGGSYRQSAPLILMYAP